MPATYQYRARNRRGQITKGEIKAASQDQASALLQKHGLTPVEIVDVKNIAFWKREFTVSRVKIHDRAVMANQLASMLDAGVPILQAVRVLSVQTETPRMADVLREVAYDIEAGKALSESLDRFPKEFPEFFVSMVRSGERSGRVSKSLFQLSEYEDRDDEMLRKVRNSLYYPAIIIVAALLLGTVAVTYALPQFLSLFEGSGREVEFPLITRMLLAVAGFITEFWWFLGLFVLFCGGLVWHFAHTPEGQYSIHAALLRMPKVGKLLSKIYLARFTGALQTLVEGDVPIVQALLISRDTLGNRIFRDIIDAAADHVKSGSTISAALEKYHQIPIMVAQMINIGERTGQLGESLASVNRFYRREVDDALEVLTQLIGPAIIVVLAAFVLVLLLAVLSPMYNLMSAI